MPRTISLCTLITVQYVYQTTKLRAGSPHVCTYSTVLSNVLAFQAFFLFLSYLQLPAFHMTTRNLRPPGRREAVPYSTIPVPCASSLYFVLLCTLDSRAPGFPPPLSIAPPRGRHAIVLVAPAVTARYWKSLPLALSLYQHLIWPRIGLNFALDRRA